MLKEILAKREEEKISMEEEIQLWRENLMSPRKKKKRGRSRLWRNPIERSWRNSLLYYI